MSIVPRSARPIAEIPKPKLDDDDESPFFLHSSSQRSRGARERLSRFAPGLLVRFNPFLHNLAVGIGDNHEASAFLLYYFDIARLALGHVIDPCASVAPKAV